MLCTYVYYMQKLLFVGDVIETLSHLIFSAFFLYVSLLVYLYFAMITSNLATSVESVDFN